MGMPPRLVRRLLFPPIALIGTFLLLTTLPLWILAAAAASRLLPGRLRALRLLWLLVVYLVCQCLGIIASFALWVASGFGVRMHTSRMRAAHYRLLFWFVAGVYQLGVKGLKLSIDLEQVDEHDLRPQDSQRPLLVFCRHAGPGDSFMLVHEVVVRLGRRPRIVLKDALQYDPCIDIVLNRLPNRFVSPQRSPGAAGDLAMQAINELAEDMDACDALLIFPEGANFTQRRRLSAIERLRSLGHHDQADLAERMTYVLAPQPGGALASIAATPHTDILFVAHTGLEGLRTIGDLWRGLPMERPVRAGWWLEPEEDVPDGREARVRWLYARWEEIDRWIAAHRTAHP
ncbi:MAG: 1-acyl-sn-glycerol-3-phosphate acyltransferase [Nitriliruptorales bacterium]|nr:1-acyl-sn-glycerol-3-phosphate acyltransferase [Nitriliruptorales bacterium]